MKPRVDRKLCIGRAVCVRLAPGAFEMDERDKAVPLDEITSSDEELLDAAEACPTGAIVLEDDEGQYLLSWDRTREGERLARDRRP